MKEFPVDLFPFSLKNPKEKLGKIGVVSSGGGLRGAVITGWLAPLLELMWTHDIMFHYLAAASVSAFMMAKLLEARTPADLKGILEHMIMRWNEVEKKGPTSVFNLSPLKIHLWNAESLLDNKPLWALTNGLDEHKAVASPIPLDIYVTEAETKRHMAISNHDPQIRENPFRLKEAMVASASLPAIFPKAKVGDNFYYDGGYVSLEGAIRAECDTIFVLFPYQREYRKPPAKNDFISTHFPTVEIAQMASAGQLRDRDAVEVKRWKNTLSLWGKNGEKDAVIAKQAREITALKAALENHLGGDEEKKNWFKKCFDRLSSFKSLFSEEDKAPAGPTMKIPRIVELYADYSPDTLQLKDFKPGDITLARERGAEQMKRVLQKLLS